MGEYFMKKKFLILICLIIFAVSISGISASEDVNQTADDINAIVNFEDTVDLSQGNDEIMADNDNCTFSDLQREIDAADEGETLYLNSDVKRSLIYHDNDSVLEDDIVINKSIIIDGQGHTIDADINGRIFKIESDNVALRNITFVNGYLWDGNGGAIAIYGNNAVITDCIFKNNKLEWDNLNGGAIFINGNNTVISDCYFKDNGISSYVNLMDGGAVYCDGNLTVINSVFEGNYISGLEYGGASGGAVYCDDNLTVVNSSFISNGISCYGSDGGAIYSKGTVHILNSIFTANYLYGVYVGGGAIRASNVFVNNSVFSDNSIMGSRSWDDPYTSSLGGAISSESADIYNSNFTNNSASSLDENQLSRGGAVYSSGITNIEDSIFINNSADNGEAGWAYLALANVDNCTFINNDIALVKAYIYAPILEKCYHGPEPFRVYLTEDGKACANANVSININGRNYVRTTDENGTASIAINLNSGTYSVTVTYEDACANSTITIISTVEGNNITKTFRNQTQYHARFYDEEGYGFKDNVEVEFNINGVFYKRKTNDEGVAYLNINLIPGEYILTAVNPVTGESCSNLITVLPNIVENHDLTKYYKNDSKFTFRLLDNQGNPVGEGVNASLNINGVFYNRTTNASGYVNMNINLNPGTYVATIVYNGLSISNTINVLPILKAEDISMKYKDGTKFETTLLDGQGNPYPNQIVTFNINGVMYNKGTDENGIARLAINLIPGEYIITSMYENGAAISNKITIKS